MSFRKFSQCCVFRPRTPYFRGPSYDSLIAGPWPGKGFQRPTDRHGLSVTIEMVDEKLRKAYAARGSPGLTAAHGAVRLWMKGEVKHMQQDAVLDQVQPITLFICLLLFSQLPKEIRFAATDVRLFMRLPKSIFPSAMRYGWSQDYDMDDELKEAILSDDTNGFAHLLDGVWLPAEECCKMAALAAGAGKLGCLKVLCALEYPLDHKAWGAAAAAGHLHILQYLKEKSEDLEWKGGHAAAYAAAAGHLDCLKFLHSISAFWSVWTSEVAAAGGHRDCLAYLAEHGCQIGPSTCAAAAENGHYRCLRYLHIVHRCPWNGETTQNAAFGGHLSCLKFAVESGCEVGNYAFAGAVEGGQVECLDYLLSAGHRPWHPLRIRKLENDRLLDCLRLLASYVVTDNSGTVVLAASLGNLAVLRRIHTFGDPLWQSATEFDGRPISPDCSWRQWAHFVGYEEALWEEGLLHVPPLDEHLPACWATLRYGSLHGAPLTPRAEALVRERRACAQEVVRCFHAARWRAKARGPQASKWAAMSQLPQDVLMTIMELAEVEIYEAVH